jgi:acetyltransferase-like isoleucine patch superfamily enzyme
MNDNATNFSGSFFRLGKTLHSRQGAFLGEKNATFSLQYNTIKMKFILNSLSALAVFSGWLIHFIWNSRINLAFCTIKKAYITAIYRHDFKHFGNGSTITASPVLRKPKCISIGENTRIGKSVMLRCFESAEHKHVPSIEIGDNINIGDYSTISCCNRIVIGNGVLTGRMVMITDNSHGHTDSFEELNTSPINRPVISKGEVVIEENVWIGEKVSIMPNVHIGKGAIIAANAVVTKDVPSCSVVGGCPAKVLKTIKNNSE